MLKVCKSKETYAKGYKSMQQYAKESKTSQKYKKVIGKYLESRVKLTIKYQTNIRNLLYIHKESTWNLLKQELKFDL